MSEQEWGGGGGGGGACGPPCINIGYRVSGPQAMY